MAIVFTYGATVCTFLSDPSMGNIGTMRQWRNPSQRSGGAKLFVYNKSVTKDLITLTWNYMSVTDQTNLLAFLAAVDYSSNAFTMTDWDGNIYSVQFVGPQKLLWTPAVEVSERDFTIELLSEQRTFTYFSYLTDESGNYITDESGNRILAART
jgi:hypothetical protein